MVLSVLGLLAVGWAPASASAHPEHAAGQLLHTVSLAQACKLAQEEFKIVCAYVAGPNDRVPPYLRRPTWEDWQTIDLLLRETVAVALRSARNADELRRYELEQLPVMLLLNPDGSERRRLGGDLSAQQLVQQLAADLSAADSVTRVRHAVSAGSGEDPLARERLADVLARHGDFAAALEEYLWCLDVGLRGNIRYAASRRRLLLRGFVALAERYPPARAALKDRQTAIEEALRSGHDDPNLARDWAELNRCLNDKARSLALFDALPAKSKARHILFDRLLNKLVEEGRYDEVLALVDPVQAFTQETILVRMRQYGIADGPGAQEVRGTRAFAVARGAALVETLAGTGRFEEARALADKILSFHDAAETRALLEHHAQRAQSRELMLFIKSRAARPQGADRP